MIEGLDVAPGTVTDSTTLSSRLSTTRLKLKFRRVLGVLFPLVVIEYGFEALFDLKNVIAVTSLKAGLLRMKIVKPDTKVLEKKIVLLAGQDRECAFKQKITVTRCILVNLLEISSIDKEIIPKERPTLKS